MKKYKIYLHSTSRKITNETTFGIAKGCIIDNENNTFALAQVSEIIPASDTEFSLLLQLIQTIPDLPSTTIEIVTDNSVLVDCITRQAWKKWEFNQWKNHKGESIPEEMKLAWIKFRDLMKEIHKYTAVKPKKNNEAMEELVQYCKQQLYRFETEYTK
jgi:ribonuclease HI